MKFFIPFAAIALLTACGGSAPKSTATADTAAGNILTPARATGAQENAPAYTLSPSQMSDLAIGGLRGNVRAIIYPDKLGLYTDTAHLCRDGRPQVSYYSYPSGSYPDIIYKNDTIEYRIGHWNSDVDTAEYVIYRIRYTDNERIETHDPANGVHPEVTAYMYTFDSFGRIIKSDLESFYYSIDTYQYNNDTWLPSVRISEFGSDDGRDSTATHYTYLEVDSVGNWLRRSSVEYKKSWEYGDPKEKEVIIWDTVRGPTEARRVLYYDK